MWRAALRFGFGTGSLLVGGWVLRAARDRPATLGAPPADIRPVAERSPHYSDGAFVNIDPASTLTMDREERRMLIRELIGSRHTGRPAGRIPVVSPVESEPAALAPQDAATEPSPGPSRDSCSVSPSRQAPAAPPPGRARRRPSRGGRSRCPP